MSPIYIENFDSQSKICEYSSEARREIPLEELKEQGAALTKGAYVRNGERYIGVYASQQGPQFFVDALVYSLSEGNWDMEVSQDGDRKRFRFLWQGKEVLNLNYHEPYGYGTHFAADEELVDFYLWMSKKKGSQRFITYYTR